MSEINKLCYKHNGSALCYKYGGSSLIYKVEHKQYGKITIIVDSDQSMVGPIKSCGNVHDVVIVSGSVSFSGCTGTSTAGGMGGITYDREITVQSVTGNTGTVTVGFTTESSGCSYPDENPPMGFSVSVTQDNGDVFSTRKNVSNVAQGAFSLTISLSKDGKVTSIN